MCYELVLDSISLKFEMNIFGIKFNFYRINPRINSNLNLHWKKLKHIVSLLIYARFRISADKFSKLVPYLKIIAARK